MARIQLPPGDLEEPYRLFSMAPNVAGGAAAYSEAIYQKATIDLRLRELLRMRIAEINQCHICMNARVPSLEAAGLTEEMLANTANFATYGGYTDAAGRYHYQPNFVGFVPAQDPQLSVLVMIDDPTAGPYTGGEVAAPVFSKIASFALQLLGIPAPTADLAGGGGAPADGQATDQGAALPAGVTRGEDGRVRGLPASQSPPRLRLDLGASRPREAGRQRAPSSTRQAGGSD